MTTVGFSYGTETLLEDCEDSWTAGDADMTASLDSADYMVGSGAAKVVVAAGASADDVMMYETGISVDLSTFSYVGMWVKSSVALAAGDVQFGYDEDASMASPVEWINLPAITADEWTRVVIAFAGSTADRNAIVSAGFRMHVDKGAFNFWADDLRGVPNYFELSCLGIRGLDDPDDVEYFPPIAGMKLDGSLYESILSWRRIISVDFGAITTKANRLLLHNWLKASTKKIWHTHDDVSVVLEDASGFGSTWLSGADLFRGFTLTFKEQTARTTNPTSWSYT